MTIKEIRQLLENPYNQKEWKAFLQNHFTNGKLYGDAHAIQLLDKTISKECFTLGNYEVDEYTKIGIFEIQLNDKVNITRNRVALRNLIKSITQQVAGAMVVFVQGDKWRFSYISKRKVKNQETNLIEDRETAPKRYTYLFGKNEKALTAAIRFDKLIQKQKENIFQLLSLNDFEEAFSVEKLSKEFFKQYKDTYEDFVQFITGKRYTKKGTKYAEEQMQEPNVQLKTIFNNNEKQARDFCKRMMGRIVFLYFIQKKGWLAVEQGKKWGEGNINYLYDLFKKSKTQNDFYSKDLVPLFFKTLNNPDSENPNNEFRFPYLNGGLFDDVQDKPFNNLQLPGNIFDTLFETFNNFNFTVHEDAPDEQTVAVDPEMLGHIFENLLEDNKDKGAFYTPKEIVHFMCQESLKTYLSVVDDLHIADDEIGKTSVSKIINQEELSEEEKQFAEKNAYKIIDALEQVKICDPAIGSGAFPMGLLQEIFNSQVYLQELKGFKKINEAEIKKHIIQESIYGVDIDAGAVDIARLRFWLSLVVEEEKPQALPNLDYKIMQGNSLLGIPKNTVFNVSEVEKLETLKEKYFSINDPIEKQELKSHINSTTLKILETANQYAPYHIDFDFKLFFSELYHGDNTGFDIVIGNPPYVQLQKDSGKLAKLYEKVNYDTFERTGDVYSLFYERGVQLLKDNGVLCFISSNKWMRANYGASTREFFAEKTHPLLLIDFGNIQVFETATVDTNILLLQNKSKTKKSDMKELFAVRFTNDFKLNEDNISEYIKNKGYRMSSLSHNAWVVGEKDIYNIKDQIEQQGIPLNKWDIIINYGIKTGFNDAFIIPTHVKEGIIKEDYKSAEIIKPVLRGKDISAWYPEYEGWWLIGTFPSLDLNIDNYKGVKKHLLSYGIERLEQNGKGRKKTGNKWFETQDQISYWKDFEKPKIIYPNMTKYLPFVYDETGIYTNQKCFIITGNHLKYLTCFLNSKLFKYCFSDNFPELQGGTRELSKVFFDKIPVKSITKQVEKPFERIVEYLVALKKENAPNTTDEFIFIYFEQIADALVFEYYFKEEFQQRNLSIAKYIYELPALNDKEDILYQLRKIYVSISQQHHPLPQAIFSMSSIPQIELIMNSN